MAVNRGKQFEEVIKRAFEEVDGVSIDRLHDQTNGFLGSTNICDFIVYKEPNEYYIECKSVHKNTLSIYSTPKPDKHGVLHGCYGNITDTQWNGLLEKSKIPGVRAGIICWFIDKDVTKYIPIELLVNLREHGSKSIRYDFGGVLTQERLLKTYTIKGLKKRVLFEYDMYDFFLNV